MFVVFNESKTFKITERHRGQKRMSRWIWRGPGKREKDVNIVCVYVCLEEGGLICLKGWRKDQLGILQRNPRSPDLFSYLFLSLLISCDVPVMFPIHYDAEKKKIFSWLYVCVREKNLRLSNNVKRWEVKWTKIDLLLFPSFLQSPIPLVSIIFLFVVEMINFYSVNK